MSFSESLFKLYPRNNNKKVKTVKILKINTPCSSAPVRCAPVASTVNNIAESVSPASNYDSPTNE